MGLLFRNTDFFELNHNLKEGTGVALDVKFPALLVPSLYLDIIRD